MKEEEITRLTEDTDCPFCTGIYWGALADGEGAVMHSMPPCNTFNAIEPVDFLEAARLKREGVEH